VELLSNAGFEVKSPFAGLDTAYKASSGNGKSVFCFVSEYDALPGIGHACGHNLICAAAIAASLSLSKILQENGIGGNIVVMGTPGEESKGGKIIMLENNALNGIDALMMVHPSWRTVPDSGSTAITRLQVSFKVNRHMLQRPRNTDSMHWMLLSQCSTESAHGGSNCRKQLEFMSYQ
jgi:metal-dependent amidase/aminoacylase/carboxypeptidase family protein